MAEGAVKSNGDLRVRQEPRYEGFMVDWVGAEYMIYLMNCYSGKTPYWEFLHSNTVFIRICNNIIMKFEKLDVKKVEQDLEELIRGLHLEDLSVAWLKDFTYNLPNLILYSLQRD